MIINKISDKNIAKQIAEKYVEWLDSGVEPSEILVLSFNSNSKKNIFKNILNLTKNNNLSDLKIYTFNGLIYNTILNNWNLLENKISAKNTSINPNLSGLEVSQYLLKQIIKEEEVKGYNSKKSLLHQIFRRYSLIVNNNLSEDEVRKKSQILKEAYGEDALKIIQKFKSKTIDLRAFDYIRQAHIFPFIFNNTDYFKPIKYLLIEDADELTPLAFDFLNSIKSQIKDKLIYIDKNGGSRCGYLCAELNAKEKLENIFNEKISDESDEKENIITLRENIFNSAKKPLTKFSAYSLSKRVDMVDKTINLVNDLLNQGVEPNDIAIITPVQDKLLKHTFSTELKYGKPLFISGNEKLIDNPLVKVIVTILKLSENKKIDTYELRVILSKYLGIPIKNCKKIFENYENENIISSSDIGIYAQNLEKFSIILDKLKSMNSTLSEKACFIYDNLIKNVSKNDIIKFNFFLKELQDFEKIFKHKKSEKFEEEIINQIENSIISENPYMTISTETNDIIISTPQKIIDNKIKTKYQFWLDVSSQEWVITDIGPLYNAWVFQKSWNKEEYTIEDNIRLSKEKTFKTLRKLILSTENVTVLSSLFDTQGAENLGGIEQYLIPENYEANQDKDKKVFSFIPRDDQKPVLEYKTGKMAISAVPGAGKTTILLALIIELMKNNINPENIYVLTYMESAARNFKDRIKNINPDNTKIPNISTIHGLALKILKENANYERLGLNSDFEICDDTQRGNILRSLSHISKNDSDDFDRAISIFKLNGSLNNIDNNKIENLLNLTQGNSEEMKLSKFLQFFCSYQEKLRQNNLIDYDDILLSAVKLLEENEDILKYYQEICEYIIEDEAQDSSSIQQRLINLLSAKHNNLIRCGDINQAITTTFTNADVEGFKKFIETSNRVDMNRSQRCTEGVWKLANSLVKYGNSDAKTPFYEIYMKPVEGKNPVEDNPVYANIYDNLPDEKVNTMRIIKSLFDKDPNCTIGVLLRNNYQVNKWAEYLNSSGFTAITRNECLGQKKIFKVIFSILKLISNPYNNAIAADAYSSLAQIGLFRPHLDKVIENYQIDFIVQDNDEIVDSDLARFHWDMNYWLSFPELTIDELALMVGFHYFSENIEKSNIYLISTLCSKLNNGSFNQVIQRLEELSNRSNLSGFKFFSEDEEDMAGGKIQIMTLHKSKGDEFDYVFLPEMTEKNLTLDINQLKLNKSSNFMENIRKLNKKYKVKSEDEIKLFTLNENYRLLYVAITRAKRRLYISSHATELYYGKEKEVLPSMIFDELLNQN